MSQTFTPVRVRGQKRTDPGRLAGKQPVKRRNIRLENDCRDRMMEKVCNAKLSRLELLPTELLEHIFFYTDSPNLPLAAPVVGARLSSEHVYRQVLRMFFTKRHPKYDKITPFPECSYRLSNYELEEQKMARDIENIPEQPQEKFVKMHWWTAERFLNFRDDLLESLPAQSKKGLKLRKTCFSEFEWPNVTETSVHGPSDASTVVESLYDLPGKLVHWPMSVASRKTIFLMNLHHSRLKRNSLDIETAERSWIEAVKAGDYEAVDSLMSLGLDAQTISQAAMKQSLHAINFEPAMTFLIIAKMENYRPDTRYGQQGEDRFGRKYPNIMPHARAFHEDFWKLSKENQKASTERTFSTWVEQRRQGLV